MNDGLGTTAAEVCARIALVAMPWHDPYLPSIQLGALKAYVERAQPGVTVDLFHYYFHIEERIGLATSQAIAQEGGVFTEALSAYHLFPSKRSDISAFLDNRWPTLGGGIGDVAWLTGVVRPLERAVAQYAREVEWGRYALVGFSLVFGQTLASMLMAKQIKAVAPHLPVVLGGPNCTGELGLGLLRAFPQVDLVVTGEGEEPLTQLTRNLVTGVERPTT